MRDENGEPEERPATWENVVVGEAKEFVGKVLGAKDLEDEGEDQVETAHEVHDDYEAERDKG